MSDLNYINYLNVAGFIINVAITFAGSPIFGFPDNAELSEKYQTIITPAGITFAIWGIIFISQGVFTVIQVIPRYRLDPIVQNDISYWYFIACLFQSAWTFAFGYEIIWLSVFTMLGILVSLVVIILRKAKNSTSVSSYWLLHFPFDIHCGWIAAAFVVNVNVLVFSSDASAKVQEVMAYLTIGYALFVAVSALFYLEKPNHTIAGVISWAAFGIFLELSDPDAKIEETFDVAVISRVKICVLISSVVVLLGNAGLGVYNCVLKRRNVSSETNQEANYHGSNML